MVNEPGIYQLSMAEYHADPCPVPSLSRSSIRDLLYRSPGHARYNHPRLNPDYQKDTGDGKFDLGSAAHSLLLEGADNVTVIEAEDWRTKGAKEARDEARREGKVLLLEKQWARVAAATTEAIRHIHQCEELGITNLTDDGTAEQSYVWREGETWLRARPDWVSHDKRLVLDYKTTEGSANPDAIPRHIIQMGYDIQAALYCRGVKALTGVEPKFVFVVQEMDGPYFCSFVSLPPQWLDVAKQKVDYGLFVWRECLETGEWPAYPIRVCYPDLPAWELAVWESKAAGVGVGK